MASPGGHPPRKTRRSGSVGPGSATDTLPSEQGQGLTISQVLACQNSSRITCLAKMKRAMRLHFGMLSRGSKRRQLPMKIRCKTAMIFGFRTQPALGKTWLNLPAHSSVLTTDRPTRGGHSRRVGMRRISAFMLRVNSSRCPAQMCARCLRHSVEELFATMFGEVNRSKY